MYLQVNDQHKIEVLPPSHCHPESPLLILAHGSSNNMYSGFLETIASHIQQCGVNVARFNFPYTTEGRKIPDHAAVLEAAWQTMIDWANSACPYSGLYIGGKSLGGLVAATVALQHPEVKGVVFLGFPLHPPGKFELRQYNSLELLQRPMLFVQGTRDPFAKMELLLQVISDIGNYARIEWVEGGDHSYKILVREGINYPNVLRNVGDIVAKWLQNLERETGVEK
jgi:hypothetical protein